MTDEIIVLPLTTHAERIRDMLIMRTLDVSERCVVNQENVIVEMNARILQYKSQFPFTFDFLVLQTVQDFKSVYIALQVINLDYSNPVAQLGDKFIYAHEDGIVTFSFDK